MTNYYEMSYDDQDKIDHEILMGRSIEINTILTLLHEGDLCGQCLKTKGTCKCPPYKPMPELYEEEY